MFGHQDHDDNRDNNQQPADNNQPQADATLTAAPLSHPGNDNQQKPAPVADNDDSAGNFLVDDEPTGAPAAAATVTPQPDDLLDIKQTALQQLSPLVGHLDQTPEEKFRTMMMMIQASDNQALIKEAYAAAQNIQDEKERAQALLDVVNEINYFTQPHQA